MTERDAERPQRVMMDRAAKPLPRRFYKHVAVSEGLGVHLDGRPVRSPLKRELVMPTLALAKAVAAEWDAQVDHINPHAMPLTKLANTSLDRAPEQGDALRGDILAYAANDLVCYRVETPEELARRQLLLWDPVISWAERRTAEPWLVTSGLRHVEQPAATLAALASSLPDSPFNLVGCHAMTTLSGSALLALMVAGGDLAPEDAWEAASVEEIWQREHWGEDAEATARHAGRWAEFRAAAWFVELANS